MVKEITPPEAWKILQAGENAVVLDVRSTMEYQYVGHPVDAVHVPLKEPPSWETDPEFVGKVRRSLNEVRGNVENVEDITILSICRSGQRSLVAAELLAADGFKDVYNILEGFEGVKDGENHRNTVNGWRVHKLPWEQS